MSHFAKIENGRVVTVIVAEKDFIDTQEGTWVQTSYNTFGGQHSLGGTPMRKNYAGIGYHYDYVMDADDDDGPYKKYRWDEDSTSWVEVT